MLYQALMVCGYGHVSASQERSSLHTTVSTFSNNIITCELGSSLGDHPKSKLAKHINVHLVVDLIKHIIFINICRT